MNKAKELLRLLEKEYPKHPHKAEKVYADYDEETNSYIVVGEDSGHAYASYADKAQANKKANEMNKGFEEKQSE